MAPIAAAARFLTAFIALSLCVEAASRVSGSPERSMEVTATAYNSVPGQTDSLPFHAAWGDTLVPGRRVIAVSRDLIPLGLGQDARVRIEGLPGEYRVMDKMGGRWSRRIDLYFGRDVEAAREWGRQRVVIHWFAAADSAVDRVADRPPSAGARHSGDSLR
ncbi:MAG: hypothetical protein JWP91_1219 [Fibrobacteres bacterium]|nr:hypothetical protein [Fibrobacterota bacterium]